MGKKKVVEDKNECGTCEGTQKEGGCAEGAGAPAPGAEGAAKTPKEKVVVNAFYTFVRKPGENEKKVPLQANQILDILSGSKDGDTEDAPFTKMSRKDLLDKMTAVVQTRQPIERILGFYQPILVKAGYITVEK